MDSLIKFRLLYDSLKQNEKKIFLDTIINSFGMDMMTTALFNHFALEITQFKPYNTNHIKTINTTLSDIIHQRKKDETSTNITCNELKLDTLPSPLISNISSFLQQSHYIHFAKVNRKTYIGCNASFSLQKLDLSDKDSGKNQIIDASKFNPIKSLTISMHYFDKFVMPIINTSHFSNLQKLTLCNASDDDIEWLLDEDAINLDMIHHLKLVHFQNDCVFDRLIDTTYFSLFLSKFRNIEYFDISSDVFLENDWSDYDVPVFQQIKGLSICIPYQSEVFIKKLIDKYAKQIESLHWNLIHSDGTCDVTEPFIHLKEIKYAAFEAFEHRQFWEIVNGTKVLEKVSVQFKQAQYVKDTIKKLLNEQKHLEFLEVDSNGSVSSWKEWISGIDEGLSVLENTKKNVFHIRLKLCGFRHSDHLNELITKIKCMIDKLSKYDIDNFVVECRIYQLMYIEDDDLKEKMNIFGDEYLWNIFCAKEFNLQFVVSNKENKMQNGYEVNGVYIK